MTTDRREFMLGLAGAGLSFGPASAVAAASHATRLADVFAEAAETLLSLAPENATYLGLDTGKRIGLKSKLNDRSWPAVVQSTRTAAALRRRLAWVDRHRLAGPSAAQYDALLLALDMAVEGGAFAFGENGLQATVTGLNWPYVVNQQSGAYIDVPELLDAKHQIEDATDADAYVERLNALAATLDQETMRIARDARLGVVPPDFILKSTLEQMAALRALPANSQRMVVSLRRKTGANGLHGQWVGQAENLVEKQIYPALDRQMAALRALTGRATGEAGVGKLPQGADYYRWMLKVQATSRLSASDIHRMGLDQNRALQSEMDRALRAQGLSEGSVGARMLALTQDRRFIYPNTDAGRAEFIAYLNGRVAALRRLMPRLSKLDLRAPVAVQRVPPDIEAGASLGYMNFPPLDGARPATYYINLKDTANWPRWTLPTLTAHETIPGHSWQGAYLAEHRGEVPLVMSLMGFNAFQEGWGLYAEQLADEHGYYDEDPFGRLGYLQAQQFRACRLVVDTGLHAMGWSRQQAIDWLVANVGRTRSALTSEVDRYCVAPGQACGYKVGHSEILRLRERMRSALGRRFDVRDFNDLVVRTGGVPLETLSSAVEDHVTAVRGGRRVRST